MWSEDRQEWVPLGQLLAGETLRAADGPAVVVSIAILNHLVPVYNIEVHGQHVYQVGQLGVLVHNACPYLRSNMIAAGTIFKAGEHAAHIVPVNGWKWAGGGLQKVIANVKNAGLIDDVANGFKATAGHLGTHTKVYVEVLVDVMKTRTTPGSILEGLDIMRDLIMKGTFK